jgi:hypothetical protein
LTLCRPLSYDLHAAPLERGQRNPQKGYERLPCARTGRRCDIGLVERVSSANSGPVWPFRALQHHPRRCGSPGRQDIATPAAVRAPALRQPNSQTDVQTMTKQEAPISLPSKSLLDKHMTRHDAPQKRDSSGRPSTPCRCTPYRYM